MLASPLRWLVRVTAFARKELVDLLRQPRLLLVLVLGPFLILLAFGAGLREEDPAVRTAFVTPDDPRLAEEVQRFADAQSERLTVVSVDSDRETALRALRRDRVDMVVAFPDAAARRLRSNEQAEVVLYHDELDPVELQALGLFARTAVDEVNQQVLRAVVERGQEDAATAEQRLAATHEHLDALRAASAHGDELAQASAQSALSGEVAGLALLLAPAAGVAGSVEQTDGDTAELTRVLARVRDGTQAVSTTQSVDVGQLERLDEDLTQLESSLEEFRQLSPRTLVSPFTDRLQRAVGGDVTLVQFYAPAVVALLLQHLVITLMGLSLVREEELGMTELFVVAPLRVFERLLGKYLAYLIIGGVVGGLLIAALVFLLGVPQRGSWAVVVAAVAAVVLASTGLGALLSVFARNDSQAVQYTMILLLASIFFSGFLLGLDRFRPAVAAISWALPVSYGIRLLRQTMLVGEPLDRAGTVLLSILALVGVALFVVNWLLFRRSVRA